MFTLQILDGGQTFLYPLERRPVSLGSGPGDEVRLGEEGVLPGHVRIDYSSAGVRLEAVGEVRVNGTPRRACELNLGDRIEIGRAVLVLGRTVARKARAEDVLGEGTGIGRRVPTSRRRRPWLPIAAVLLGALGVFWFAGTGGGSSNVRGELRHLARLRESAQVERAAAHLERLRRDWAAATDDRLQQLDVERDALLAIGAVQSALRSSVLDPADRRDYADWNRELRRLEAEGEPAERVAARLVRSNLRETYERRPQPKLATAPSSVPVGSPVNPPVDPQATSPAVPSPPIPLAATPPPSGEPVADGPAAQVVPTGGAPEAWRSSLAEAERCAGDGMFAQALSLLQAAVAEAMDPAAVAVLQQRIEAVRGDAGRALSTLLAEAAALRQAEPAAAVAVLQTQRHRFPTSPEFAALSRELLAAEAAVAAAAQRTDSQRRGMPVDEGRRMATLASLRTQMDSVRAAEERGAFTEAAVGLRAAAAAVHERDPDFAARLQARADEAELLAELQSTVAEALAAGRTAEVTTQQGLRVTLRRAAGAQLFGVSTVGDEQLSFVDLGATGIEHLATQLSLSGPAALGAATLLYRQGEAAHAERLLAKALQKDAALKEPVDRVIARGRGEPLDQRGYTLGKDGFVSARSIEVQKEAKKLAARLEGVLRDKNPAVRETFLGEVMASGPDGVKVLVAAFQREFVQQVAKLEAGSLKKQVDRLAAQCRLLDDARQNAKELIFDQAKYFYPYRPPAVTGEKFAEYNRVQAEIDRRVASLRTLWQDDRTRVRVPAALRQDLLRLDWVAKVLGDLGELDHATLAAVGWARALPPGDSIGVRDYCASLDERAELQEWRRIEVYNRIVGKELSSSQRELLKVTNEYRAMFRHRPLAIVPCVCEAAQGHADEMGRLGYFAHMSPTPGRKTPYDRMRLSGYKFGASENIALVDGAAGAHFAWCHSSGHHRNLLDPGHREIGIGSSGRNWVQNFGSGTAHRDLPAWAASASERP